MENLIRRLIREEIERLAEIDPNLTRDPKQMAMAKKLFGDESAIILNKLQWSEELTPEEESEARKNYLASYIIEKVNLSGNARRTNPINKDDLNAVFEAKGHVLDDYLKMLVQRNSNVEQISSLERAALLNIPNYSPANASDEIAKKYIIKMLLNLDVPQEGENKWTKSDSFEIQKAYYIALTDSVFKDVLEKILYGQGKQNSKLYRKLKGISKPQLPAWKEK